MRTRRALVPLLTVAVLTACGADSEDPGGTEEPPGASAAAGDGGASGAAGEQVRTCDLLTVEEVAGAVGSPVKAGVETSGPALTGGEFTSCVWPSDDPAHPADTATLTLYDNADAADSVRGEDSAALTGIGDAAFSDTVSSVWVYVGDRSFFAQWYVFGTMDDEGLEQSTALAAAAAAKLG